MRLHQKRTKPILINESGLYSLILSGKDVARILGYAEPRSAVSKKVDDEDRGVAKMETPSGIQNMTIINESGLYSLILSSKLPDAKKFKRWVTSVVLPKERGSRCLRMASVRMGGSWQQRYA